MKPEPFEPEPLNEVDFKLALAIKSTIRKHGSLAAFFKSKEEERKAENRMRYAEQMVELLK